MEYIIIAALLIILVCEKLSLKPYKRIRNYFAGRRPINRAELYICKDTTCDYGWAYCCMSCGQRKKCKHACEDYNGPCEWRVKNGEDQG